MDGFPRLRSTVAAVTHVPLRLAPDQCPTTLITVQALTCCVCSPNEFKSGKMSSSIESDRGSIMNALGVFERQDELVGLTRL